MNLTLFVTCCLISLGIGYSVKQSDFDLLRKKGREMHMQTGCMKGVAFIIKNMPMSKKQKRNAIYYCNKLKGYSE